MTPRSLRVLLVGSGAREHALADAVRRSPLLGELHCAPGNPGLATAATCHPLAAVDVDGLVALATELRIDLVVVGPEAPLVAGLADGLRGVGVPVFGPGAAAARLEGSKRFAKDVMAAAGVPTAAARVAASPEAADAAIEALGGRVVVKADGLAAGKGVVVCDDAAAAREAARALLRGDLGQAGRTVLVEERLEGPEVSVLALCDGRTAVALAPAQDHKRIGDGDTGPNTGGMGAYSPVPGVDPEATADIVDRVHRPVLLELARRGVHFSGCLYAGLMLTPDGLRVLEFNVRLGDPEAQAILPRLDGDLLSRLYDAAVGRLTPEPLPVSADAAVTVVLASAGYPTAAAEPVPIDGVEAAADRPGVAVHHAGTALRDGRLVTAGGRVLTVTALGASIGAARTRAYDAADRISFDGLQRRSDIAAGAAGTARDAV
ncbi:MAG: Phosphoribosylamine--glycine ligase [uncultured Thermoleophilia bacterium]|uniref:Phosphoribosylamine--glycine ligase n=1 Tax=uncultured Thermoleophilia bacterium TaxID=1497501 RepID=A0A6J4TQV3_9ACTN|nr:MAG: Phosphoribosylamine--glycine ligase [uncultured Thermoleophilia bacterium]